MLSDVLAIALAGEARPLVPARRHDAQCAVVEGQPVFAVHDADVIGPVCEVVETDHVDICGVSEHQLLKQVECEAGEIDRLGGHCAELLRVVARERFCNAARQAEDRVNGLTRGDGDEVAQFAPHGDDPLHRLYSHAADHAENIPFRGGSARADDKVGATQKIEVQCVIFGHERAVDQFADLTRGGRRHDAYSASRALVDAMW